MLVNSFSILLNPANSWLNSVADHFLAPSHYLFKVKRLEVDDQLTPAYAYQSWVYTALAIISFVPLVAIGATLKVAALIFSAKLRQQFAKDYILANQAIPLLTKQPLLEIKGYFKHINSSKLSTLTTKSVKQGQDFFKQKISFAAPVIMRSSFIPQALAEHLMSHKNESALSTKYQAGGSITNMEGACSSLVTLLGELKWLGDKHWKGNTLGVTGKNFGQNRVRTGILNATCQPDFEKGASSEKDQVMLKLVCPEEEALFFTEEPIFPKILTIEQKKDDQQRLNYDRSIRNCLIYHLTADHGLPAREAILPKNILPSDQAAHAFIEKLITDQLTPQQILAEVKGKFMQLAGGTVKGEKISFLISLEMLTKFYIERSSNLLNTLEQATPQGYIYRIDPPSLFASALDSGASILNALEALSLTYVAKSLELKNLKLIIFNDYADQAIIPLLTTAFSNTAIKVGSPLTIYDGDKYACQEPWACVYPLNPDPFGNNCGDEEAGSLEGVFGYYTNAQEIMRNTTKFQNLN